jgi:DNA-binding NarL/FixJ family response regulator
MRRPLLDFCIFGVACLGRESEQGHDVIKTLIAEQTCLIRAGLVAFLSAVDDIEVVAELRRGDQVLSASRCLRPDVAVLAATLPVLDGFAAACALHAQLPSCHSLIMGDRCNPASLRRAMAAHASGFIAADAAPDVLTESVRASSTRSGSRPKAPLRPRPAHGTGWTLSGLPRTQAGSEGTM